MIINKHRYVHSTLAAVWLLACITTGLVIAHERHGPTLLLSGTSECPRVVETSTSEWCMDGSSKALPWSVELWTGKPFVEGVGRISVIGANGPHFIASGCHDNYTGALIVPVYWNHKTNLASGPTGGNAKLDLNWNLKFYVRTTNPPSLTFEYFDTDYTTKPWWACSNTSNGVEIGGLGSPDVTVKKQLSQLRAVSENTTVAKSENFDYLLGYFVITNWKSSRWKSYIAGKAQIQFPIVQVPSMNERITHFTGSGLSIDKSPMNNSPYQYLWDPLVGLGTSFPTINGRT